MHALSTFKVYNIIILNSVYTAQCSKTTQFHAHRLTHGHKKLGWRASTFPILYDHRATDLYVIPLELSIIPCIVDFFRIQLS